MEEGGTEDNATAVPKFASFRPKLKTDPRKHDIDRETTPDNGHNQGSHRKSELALLGESPHGQQGGKSSHREHREPHKRHHRRRSQGGDRRLVKEPATDSQIITWDDSPKTYAIDNKGDAKNLVYGAIHQYSLPTYYRAGAGNVIGLDNGNKIDRELSSEKGIVIQSRFSKTTRSREKYIFARNERKGIRKLRIKSFDKGDAALEAGLDYIPFRLARNVRRNQLENVNSSSENDDHHYRSIEGKAKAGNHPEDKDLEYDSESSRSDYEHMAGSWNESALHLNVELSQRVEVDPTNIDAWLELVNHQGNLIGDRSGRRKLTSAERLSTADIKLSMYEKALGKVGRSRGRERLLIGLMEEGSKVWENNQRLTGGYSFKKLSSKWQTVLRENPNFVGLWTKYLDFKQTKSATFRYEDIRNVYIECVDVLRTTILNTASPHCFVENATAIWQALLEIHLFTPTEIASVGITNRRGEEVLLSSFQRFWESEVPRIGENGAEGWNSFVAKGEAGIVPEPRTDSLEVNIDKRHIFRSWATAEKLRALESRDPARTIDEVEEDDPYRVILFSDIKDFIFYFDSKQARLSLLNGFMAFCTLPPLPYSDGQSWPQAWWTDSFIRNEGLEQGDFYYRQYNFDDQMPRSKENLLPWQIRMEPEHPNPIAQQGPFAFKFRNFSSSPETLFSDSLRWFTSQDKWLEIYPGDIGPVKIVWLRRVLKSLASRDAPEYNLAEYYLAFEWKNFPEGAKKVAKSLLKKDRTNLRLYNSYGMLEWRSENIDTATSVFVTTIEMSKTLGEIKQQNSILLWKTWVWELLQKGDMLEAWQKLLCIPEGKVTAADAWLEKGGDPHKVTPAAILKTRRFLNDGRDGSLALGYNDDAVYFVECSAILEYLHRSRDADAAVAIFQKASDSFDKQGLAGCIAQELLHHGKARLLHFHATMSRSFKPSLLRDELAESIKMFPQNTIFLSLFSWNETRSRIDDRVRSIMTDVVLKDQQNTIIGWIFSIWTELRATPGAGYNTNSTRAAFERAVSSESGKCNPSLWKFYLEFECQQGDINKANPSYLRLPYLGFAFLAFTQLRDIDFDELRNIYRALGEKELRVHIDLEDAFDTIEENGRGTQGGGGQSPPLPIKLPDDMSTDEN
ncbi:hypothetical protein FGG08_003592 [Glutinoglossum americanum]|uniref:DUF1740-domain-containing protein n=1 Tax=Glutinoglossum americanum TaxID=1670608 RepID=A0A9P8L3C3_9PEZI|nr:hypothetical protein FGG08_003592 [Glutinoglossum americanum]